MIPTWRDNRFAALDAAALSEALLAVHVCPRCRTDLQPVALTEDVWGCASCRQTWHVEREIDGAP